MNALDDVGAVVIGRNESTRLALCLASIPAVPTVYVDSGSTDDSVNIARKAGVAAVVELEQTPERPFTAARARNEGFHKLLGIAPGLRYVQFVDGDCELRPEWMETASRALRTQAGVAVVSGRLIELHPEASLYNRLCDIEWNVPCGETKACGGIAMFDADVFESLAGFRENMIAGEEPELCLRIRRAERRILHLPDAMGSHDAAMDRFSQWWRRMVRSGYAYAEGAHLHGRSPEHYWAHEVRSIWFWGALLPIISIVGGMVLSPAFLMLFALYPVLAVRIYRGARKRGFTSADRVRYTINCVLSKFAGAYGAAQFHARRLLKRRIRIIEYKQRTGRMGEK